MWWESARGQRKSKRSHGQGRLKKSDIRKVTENQSIYGSIAHNENLEFPAKNKEKAMKHLSRWLTYLEMWRIDSRGARAEAIE